MPCRGVRLALCMIQLLVCLNKCQSDRVRHTRTLSWVLSHAIVHGYTKSPNTVKICTVRDKLKLCATDSSHRQRMTQLEIK